MLVNRSYIVCVMRFSTSSESSRLVGVVVPCAFMSMAIDTHSGMNGAKHHVL